MSDPLRVAALELLGLDLRAAAERQAARPTWRTRLRRHRPLVSVALAISVAGTAAAATTGLLPPGEPLQGAPAQDFSIQMRPLLGSDRLSGVRVDDPGAGLPWGLKVFSSQSGRQCVVMGRVQAGELGAVSTGTFQALPLSGPQQCADFDGRRRPIMLQQISANPAIAPDEQRTVLFGIASEIVTKVQLEHDTESRTLVPDSDRLLLAVFEGAPDIVTTVYFTDGTKDVLDRSRPPCTAPIGTDMCD